MAPTGDRRMSANPHANGGLLLRDLDLPDFRDYAVPVARPACETHEATRVLGTYLRDVIRRNPDRFRLMGPDETASNRLSAVFEATGRTWLSETSADDDHLSAAGRVMEVLSEHLCQGWLEGYLLTGRHGMFDCYEAFVHIVDSMFNQHTKWLSTSRELPWRRPIASLNYLLSSHVWRQDHNGASHQDPGFIDLVANKRPEVVRVYLPPDGNTLLSVADHCLRSRDYVNVIVAGKQPALSYLAMDEAVAHCTRGLGIWQWASTATGEPTWCWPARETCRRWRRWQPPTFCGGNCQGWVCGWSTSSTSCGCSRSPSTHTAWPTRNSMQCSLATSRSSSPTTGIRG
ncbi:D-xylulose 5-phosphate/D-fructose 6-phosphate phosphoketolase family protein [Mycobacterium kansasii]|uniref:D-xylulose 5-phosphate/D-fructose 6-phosphate phosphoketolase family protein n=1 Tax=Mycobacterium kansasii TaxID=1768 RepID=A0A1V3X2Z1_MYCKA|nr:D-xylulose 5-phosphate/D-fructose 6-phosphate phosphoketolase family protein [Mycobacterium kansasii]